MPKDSAAEYDFLGQIAVSGDLTQFQTQVTSYCCTAFSAQSVIALQYHRDSEPKLLFRHIPDDNLRNWFDKFYCGLGYALDPFFQAAFETEGCAAYHLRELSPDRFETSEYYSSYFATTGMVDEIGGLIGLSPDSALHLSIGRNAGSTRYRAHEIARFRLLARVLMPKLSSLLPSATLQSGPVAPDLKQRFQSLEPAASKISDREAEVAALIVQGNSSRAIGLKLGISVQTVKVHRRNLYRKLSISSQSELFGLLVEELGKRQVASQF